MSFLVKNKDPKPRQGSPIGPLLIVIISFMMVIYAAYEAFPRSTTKTSEVLKVADKVVETPVPAPSPTGCLPDTVGTLVAVSSEHVATGKDEDWRWRSAASFTTDEGLTVTCAFDYENLVDIWKPGMKMRTEEGERTIGAYKSDAPIRAENKSETVH